MKQLTEISKFNNLSQSIMLHAIWPSRKQFFKNTALYISNEEQIYIITILQNIVHPTKYDLCQYLQIKFEGQEQMSRLKINYKDYKYKNNMSQLVKIQIQNLKKKQINNQIFNITAIKQVKQNNPLESIKISKINEKNDILKQNYKQNLIYQKKLQMSQASMMSSQNNNNSTNINSLQTLMRQIDDESDDSILQQNEFKPQKSQKIFKKIKQNNNQSKVSQPKHDRNQMKSLKNNNYKILTKSLSNDEDKTNLKLINQQLKHNYQLVWDKDTVYAEHFQIENNKFMRRTQQDSNFYQLTSLYPIPKQSEICLQFKFDKNGKDVFSKVVGLITENRKQQQNSGGYDQNESIGYWSRNYLNQGCIYIDGVQEGDYSSDLLIMRNNILSMYVNTINYEVSFKNSSQPQKKWTYKLQNKHWREQPIYIFVNMYEKDAALQWIVQ